MRSKKSVATLIDKTHFVAKNVGPNLGYIWCVDFKNEINFAELALDFEIFLKYYNKFINFTVFGIHRSESKNTKKSLRPQLS